MTKEENILITEIYGEVQIVEYRDAQNIFDFVEVENDIGEKFLFCLSTEEEIFYPEKNKLGGYEGLVQK